MTTSIDSTAVIIGPTEAPSSQKRKRSFSATEHGIATPPKLQRSTNPFSGLNLKSAEHLLLPTPPNSIHASPEPSTAEGHATLLAFIHRLKDGRTLLQSEASFTVTAEEFERFEQSVRRDKPLSWFYRKKLRYEWDCANCVFTVLKEDVEMQEICSRISQCLEERLREVADSKSRLENLDSWERRRVKELADMIRPLPLRRLDIRDSRMSPDLCLTFGTTESFLGVAPRHAEPLVVFEVRRVEFLMTRRGVERRALGYLDVSGQKCPFTHRVKTVVLIYCSRDGREVQTIVARLGRVDGKCIMIARLEEASLGEVSQYIILSLADFLPQDAIDLGFKRDKNGRRACDDTEIRIDINQVMRPSRE
ncbi:hypothetical protein FKW77_000534 [Venturia effusa]|uniref:Uncharacterized protein n=1 Tax=Venturia effusa TaxID=50376 RepID=A0A517LPC6_9PEZI|nr:hypothetical protein FKW77_000534 [Venturia effusa]